MSSTIAGQGDINIVESVAVIPQKIAGEGPRYDSISPGKRRKISDINSVDTGYSALDNIS